MTIRRLLVSKSDSSKRALHYVDRYIKFIEQCQRANEEYSGYFEYHHVCPKSLYPEYENLKESPWNGARLTPRQHFISHWMLARIFGGKMWYALRVMAGSPAQNDRYIYRGSYAYDECRRRFSEELSLNNPMKNKEISNKVSLTKREYYKTNDHHRLNSSHTDESRGKISRARLKTNGMKDKVWITNGAESKAVDRDCHIPEGWAKGFYDKSRNTTPGVIEIYNQFGFLAFRIEETENGVFKRFCEVNGLPFRALVKSYRENVRVEYKSSGKGSGQFKKYKYFQMWYAIKRQKRR